MSAQLSFDSFFISLAGGIGTLQFFHLFLSKRENSFANRILAFFLLFILYLNLVNWLWLVGLLIEVPIFFRTTRPLSYVFAPLVFIYLRATLNNEKSFKKYDWLLFIPVVLVLAEFTPFYLSPVSYKVQCIAKATLNRTDSLDGLLVGHFHSILFIIYDIIYAIILFSYIYKFKKKRGEVSLEEKRITTWVRNLTAISLVVIVFLIVFYFIKLDQKYILRFYFLQNSAVVYFISIYLLIQPAILDGMYLARKKKNDLVKNDIISQAKFDYYNTVLEKIIFEEKVFLEKKLSLKLLSEKTGITIHHLSAFINKK